MRRLETSHKEPVDGRRLGLLGSLRAAARRFLVLLVALTAAIAAVSLAFGLLLGSSANRSLSLGFYLGGAALVLGGFFFGHRGPYRTLGEGHSPRLGRSLRRATPDELDEAINMSAVLVALGFALLAIGAAVDDRYRLL